MNTSNIKFKDVNEYISSFPTEVQSVLKKIRSTIKKAAPKAKERISYGMPFYEYGGKGYEGRFIYFAAFKKHISLFITPRNTETVPKEILPFHISKATYKFPLDKPFPFAILEKTVKVLVRERGLKDSQTNKLQKARKMTSKISNGILHKVTHDIQKALTANEQLLAKWNSLTPIQRNEWICWVTIVKKAETRAEHIDRMVAELNEGKRQPCCWPGCPHRRPKAKKWFNKLNK